MGPIGPQGMDGNQSHKVTPGLTKKRGVIKGVEGGKRRVSRWSIGVKSTSWGGVAWCVFIRLSNKKV